MLPETLGELGWNTVDVAGKAYVEMEREAHAMLVHE